MKTTEDSEGLNYKISCVLERPPWFSFVCHAANPIYFQLQLGCVLLPLNVNCFTFVPSASMLKI